MQEGCVDCRKPLPEPEPGRHHVNELDRLRRQMREKDLQEMCRKLEQLKAVAKSSEEIILTLEDIRENLDYLESEVSDHRDLLANRSRCFRFV